MSKKAGLMSGAVSIPDINIVTTTKESFTTPEAAEYIGVSRSSFYRVVRAHLPAVRYGEKMVRYRRADLDAFIESNVDEQ